MANFKPVIGFDDNLSNHLQNYAHTAYAVSKMRAGRTPKDENSQVITDANKIFRPGLFYLEAGTFHTTNTEAPSDYPAYLYMYVQDPDESLKGGHALKDSENPTWHKNVPMNVRQVLYSSSSLSTIVTSRIGSRMTAIDSLSTYTVVANVQHIQSDLSTTVLIDWHYAYVEDIAMWIRYKVTAVIGTGNVVTWEPAITWSDWKSITGETPVKVIDGNTTLTPNTRYICTGNYTLTLPDANDCELGAKVTIEQWRNSSKIIATNTAVSQPNYEMYLNPGLIPGSLVDMKIHDDTALLPQNSLFTNEGGYAWGSGEYKLAKLQLKRSGTETKAPERYCIYTVTETGVITLHRACYTDIVDPYSPVITYVRTADIVFSAKKTYYTKSTVEGVEVYTPATVVAGAVIQGEYYEASGSAEWHDATGATLSELTLAGVRSLPSTTTYFTVSDVADNVTGAGEYIFEVTMDNDPRHSGGQSNNKIWILERCSDLEAVINRLSENVGQTISDHTAQIYTVTNQADANAAEVAAIKRKYVFREKYIRLLTTNSVMGDNAKVSGEELIVYDDNKYLDPANLTESSYIVEFLLARYTPVYQCAKYNGDARLVWLPTRNANMLGLKIVFLLEPGAKIKVFDDCSTQHLDPYEFNGVEESVRAVPYFTRIEFELQQYRDSNNVYQLVWVFNRSITNTNASITTRDIQEAISTHNTATDAHDGVLAKASELTAHANNATHITAAERELWNAGAGSAVTEAKVNELIAAHNDAAASHSDKVTNTSLATTLQAYVKDADLHDKVVAILDEELVTREW